MSFSRYAMLAQFCNEMWIVVANCSEKYREFLNSGGRTPSADDPSAFLNLQMNGPFDIFTQKDVIIHAAIVVALTIQLYTEAQPGAGEGEGESKDEGGGQGGDEDEDGNEGKGESGDEGSDQNGGDDEDEIKRSIRQLLE